MDSKDSRFSGTLELTEYHLGARVAGRLAAVFVEEGDEVKKGRLIATLDRFEQAQHDYNRAAELFKSSALSEQEVERAQMALDDQSIVSPVDGVVLLKIHEPGEIVSMGSPVVSIGNPKRLWVKIYVPENLIHHIQMNQKAEVRFDGMDQAFSGRVGFIATQSEFTPRNVQTPEERATQTFAVKIILDNPKPFLKPGVSADVFFPTETDVR